MKFPEVQPNRKGADREDPDAEFAPVRPRPALNRGRTMPGASPAQPPWPRKHTAPEQPRDVRRHDPLNDFDFPHPERQREFQHYEAPRSFEAPAPDRPLNPRDFQHYAPPAERPPGRRDFQQEAPPLMAATRTATQMSFGARPADRGAPPPVEYAQPEPEPPSMRLPVHAAAPERPRKRNWALWISASFAAVSLVAAGYMAALVQLGSRSGSSPRLITDTSAASDPGPAAITAEPEARMPAPAAAPARAEPSLPERDEPAQQSRKRGSKTGSSSQRDKAPHAPIDAPSEEQEPVSASLPEAPAPAPAPPALAPSEEHAPAPQDAPVLTVKPLETGEGATVAEALAPAAQEQNVAPTPGSPNTRPEREDVQRTLASLRPQMEQCAAGRHGLVDATVTIAPNGRVTYSLIRGHFVGSPEGSCMARALRAATFPTFSGPSIKVGFPYAL